MAETPTPPRPAKDIQPKRVNAMVSLLTGAICGGIECIVVWPTENIKTQLQLQGRVKEPKFTSFSGGVKYVVSNHGIRALYKGLPPILLGVLPKSGIRFGTQAFLKQKMLDSNTQLPSNIINLLSGIGAGACEAFLAATPMETVKTKTIEMNCGFIEGVKRIVAVSGIGGLYKGMTSTVLKQSSNQGLRFLFMGVYRDFMSNGETKLHPLQSLAGGMGAGCFSTLGNNPIDVVKTRMQGVEGHKYKNTIDCFFTILRQEGIGGLYSGVFPRMYRVVPGQGVLFMSFDMIQPMVARLVE